ncbi:unnamed protein product, partial [Symbiodinium sp. KB8]
VPLAKSLAKFGRPFVLLPSRRSVVVSSAALLWIMRDSERANRESPEGRLQKAAFDARRYNALDLVKACKHDTRSDFLEEARRDRKATACEEVLRFLEQCKPSWPTVKAATARTWLLL